MTGQRKEILEDVYKTEDFQLMISQAFDRIINSESEYGKVWITYENGGNIITRTKFG